MPRSVITLSLVLITGAIIGSSLVYFTLMTGPVSSEPDLTGVDNDASGTLTAVAPPGANKASPADAQTTAAALAAEPAAADEIVTGARHEQQDGEEKTGESAAGAMPSAAQNLVSLQAQLAVEASARRSLEVQLSEVKATLEQLQQQLEKLSRTQEPPAQRFGNNRQIDEAALVAAGLASDYAVDLAQRLNQQEMDMLYLRDQAIREDWIDTPRYREEVEALRSTGTSLREELDADGYDRYLYATGQPNRVVVSSVIASSPGQVVGLQPGDRIVSYNGDRIFSPNDLRNATSESNLDETVAMQVDRGGQMVEYFLPAGPIGVHIEMDNVEP